MSALQREQLIAVLHKYPEVFSDTPGLCTPHEVSLLPGFTSKRLQAYRVPHQYKAEVDKLVFQLLQRGFIELSNSPQASPLVVVLKQLDADVQHRLRIDCK